MAEEVYGFLPNPESIGGSLFMLLVYGYILLQGANLLADGSEMLLEIFSPGLIGGLVLPILGALPDCLIIVISGLGPKETAAEEVKVGLGTLAGSTIMLLTIAWAGSLFLGAADFDENGVQKEKIRSTWHPAKIGVSVDKPTTLNAAIMAVTTLLYLVVHIPYMCGLTEDPAKNPKHGIPAIVGAVVCLVSLVVYSIYQIIYPELRRHIVRKERQRQLRFAAVKRFAEMAQTFGGLVGPEGQISREATDNIFDMFDADRNGTIDRHELRGLLIGLDVATHQPGSANIEEDVDHYMKEFDSDVGGNVSKEEFHLGIQKWVMEKRQALDTEYAERKHRISAPEDYLKLDVDNPNARPLIEEDDEESDDEEIAPSRNQILMTALLKLAMGTFVAAFFADPMVGSVVSFSAATGIKKFIVAFVVTPLASNASELISSLKFAMRKKKKNISMTYSQIYGAVTMNNTLCLGLFLLVVYGQQLTWDYTAEVTVIMIPTIIMGITGVVCRNIPVWVGFLVPLLYIASIAGVYVLEEVFHLS
ncbi:hypothetical protein BSKO_08666 [Bryopsis sp. KO-2023]|nr:hypothetical protein BSKO_08666 [Bryopsis sp. KO-2023]